MRARLAVLAIVACAVLGAAAPAQAQLSSGEISRVVRSALPGIRLCYERALRRDPTFAAGRVMVRFTIAPNGTVRSADIRNGPQSRARDPFTTCLTKQFKRMRFAPPNATITVSYPFNFSGGGP